LLRYSRACLQVAVFGASNLVRRDIEERVKAAPPRVPSQARLGSMARRVQAGRDFDAFSVLIDLNVYVESLFEHALEPRQQVLARALMLLHAEQKAVEDGIVAALQTERFEDLSIGGEEGARRLVARVLGAAHNVVEGNDGCSNISIVRGI
jgi:hypothetical protein